MGWNAVELGRAWLSWGPCGGIEVDVGLLRWMQWNCVDYLRC